TLRDDDFGRHHENDEKDQGDVHEGRHVDPTYHTVFVVGDWARHQSSPAFTSLACTLERTGVGGEVTATRCAINTRDRASVLARIDLAWRWRTLYMATAGMATRSPTAVATRASAMAAITSCGAPILAAASAAPAATAWSPSASKAITTPITVPNNPINGALFPSVPKNAKRRSSLIRCRAEAPLIASSAERAPRSASSR